jgi:hypothetical protein
LDYLRRGSIDFGKSVLGLLVGKAELGRIIREDFATFNSLFNGGDLRNNVKDAIHAMIVRAKESAKLVGFFSGGAERYSTDRMDDAFSTLEAIEVI